MTFSPFKVRKCVIMSFCVDFILCQVLLSFFTHGSSPKIILLGTEKKQLKIFKYKPLSHPKVKERPPKK